jgi:hypothetical protein
MGIPRLPLAVIGVLLLAASARTQDRTGTIRGKVQDGSIDRLGRGGRQIANAKITISDAKLKEAFLATTDNRGEYTVSKLPMSGTYKVSAEVAGFSPVVYRDVQLGPSGTIRLDFELRLRAVSPPEEVVVGSIDGTVRDQTGSALPGTRITISDERFTRQESWTNGLGEYNIQSLDGGTVRVRAQRRGFLTFDYNAVPLGSPGRLLRDFTLVLDTTSQPADALAVTFLKRLAETRDFAVLIPELFAPGFDDYLAEQFKSSDGVLRLKGQPEDITIGPGFYGRGRIRIDPSLVPALNRAEIRNYFAQSANFTYFSVLRLLTSLPAEIFSDENQGAMPAPPTFSTMFPEVLPLLRDDPVLSLWTNPAGESEVRINSVEQFRRTLSTLERVVPLMRAKVSNPPAERSVQYGSFVNQRKPTCTTKVCTRRNSYAVPVRRRECDSFE